MLVFNLHRGEGQRRLKREEQDGVGNVVDT
jgi:hypothetical protein